MAVCCLPCLNSNEHLGSEVGQKADGENGKEKLVTRDSSDEPAEHPDGGDRTQWRTEVYKGKRSRRRQRSAVCVMRVLQAHEEPSSSVVHTEDTSRLPSGDATEEPRSQQAPSSFLHRPSRRHVGVLSMCTRPYVHMSVPNAEIWPSRTQRKKPTVPSQLPSSLIGFLTAFTFGAKAMPL